MIGTNKHTRYKIESWKHKGRGQKTEAAASTEASERSCVPSLAEVTSTAAAGGADSEA